MDLHFGTVFAAYRLFPIQSKKPRTQVIEQRTASARTGPGLVLLPSSERWVRSHQDDNIEISHLLFVDPLTLGDW